MQLTLQSEKTGDMVVVRCSGRIVRGEEAQFLQREMEKLTERTNKIVLQLAEVNYVDSGGLGVLVRLRGVLREAKGELKVCQLQPFVREVLRVTNMLIVFHPYASEKDAIDAFSVQPPTEH